MVEGSCLCGYIKFHFDGPIQFFNHCHCSQCRKAHGAAFGSFLHINSDSFRWICGSNHVKTYKAQNQDQRNFCGNCGSSVPVLELDHNIVIIPAGILDTTITVKPMAHIFVDSKASWYEIGDDLPKFSEYASDDFIDKILTNG